MVMQPVLAVSSEEPECLSPWSGSSDDSSETSSQYFEQRFAEAEQLRQLAAKAGAEWLKTEELLLNSKEQAGNGNWSTAFQLIHKACKQADSALQQAEYESKAWKHRVVD